MRAGEPETTTIRIPVEVYEPEAAAVLDAGENYVATDVTYTREKEHLSGVGESAVGIESSPTISVELEAVMGEMEKPYTKRSPSIEPDPDVYPQAAKVHERALNELRDARERFGGCNRLVLGTPQLKSLNDWLSASKDAGTTALVEIFGVREVVGVPGPMIHAVRPIEAMVDD